MRQNKFICNMGIFCVAMLCVGCTEDGNLVDGNYTYSLKAHQLSISPKQYSFLGTPGNSGSTGDVTTIDTPWKFSSTPSWLNVNPQNGSSSAQVTFSAETNPSSDASRTAVFFLTSTDPDWEYKTAVSASQDAAFPYVKLLSDNSTLSFTGKAGKEELGIETNSSLSISTSDSWLKASLSSDKKHIVIEVDENKYNSSRTGYVTVKASYSSSVSITVYQTAATMTAETAELNFDNTPATYKLAITSDASWTAATSESWISVFPTSGEAGTSQTEISVTANTDTQPREGYVYFYIGNNKLVQVKIYQRGIYIDTGDAMVDISASGETRKLNVKSNTSWTVTSDSEWMSITPSSGSGETEATVTISDNPSLSERRGYLIFESDSKNIKEEKLVRQYGKTFSVETTVVNFSDKSGTSTIDVNSDGAWNAEKQESYEWFDIEPVTVDGANKLQVSVQENYTTEERTGYVNISLYDKTYQIAIHQDSKYLNVNSSALKFTSKGGTSNVDIATNDAWKASVEAGKEWLSTDVSEGEGNCKMTVNLSDNATVTARKAYVDVTSNYAGITRLNYEQAGRYLTVDKSDFTFFAKGGTSTLTTISSDGVFKVSQQGGWFQINKVSDNTFTVSASENKGTTERTGSITIELTDLSEGELKVVLPVMQVETGATFTKGDFTEDKNWNLSEGHNATITVIGFTADKSWNVNPNVSTTIKFTGYGNDASWNKKHNSNMDVNNSSYGDDGDWNKKHNNNDNITGTGFGTDNNWNQQ